jgi:hypothetical protein
MELFKHAVRLLSVDGIASASCSRMYVVIARTRRTGVVTAVGIDARSRPLTSIEI